MRHRSDNSLVWPACGIRRPAAGYTLTELLVVIFILSIIVVAALPVAKRVMDDARSTESARQLNAQAALAKTMAGRNNRPYGLWFEYETPIGATGTIRQCTQIYLAEVQPPYTGDLLSGSVAGADTSNPVGPWPLTFTNATILPSLVESNEPFLIRFDYKGHWYAGYRDGNTPANFYLYGLGGADGQWGVAGVDDNSNSMVDDASEYMWPGSDDLRITFPPPLTRPQPFQVLRSPRRVGRPLVMTGGTCVDVQYSGMGPNGVQFAGISSNRLVVMFAPDGSVDSVFDGGTPFPATGTLHFLIGAVEKVGEPLDATGGSNLHDPNSFWVSIGSKNGSVTSTDNLPDSSWADWTPAGQLNYLTIAREAATTRRQRGGN